MARPTMEKVDVRERGGIKDGQPQVMDRRLFMQLLAFGGCAEARKLTAALANTGITGALYEDLNDPRGVALVTASEDPDYFVTDLRRLLNQEPFASLTLKPQFTMFGRTYSMGYEPDLEEALFTRPRHALLNPAWPWAVWYPLRREGTFVSLSPEEQRDTLMEHGMIGRAYGEADLAHDIRLACYGLDQNDNDFVVGLLGKALHPLSAVVQSMRKTKQTSTYLKNLGPFWIGKAVWQSPR